MDSSDIDSRADLPSTPPVSLQLPAVADCRPEGGQGRGHVALKADSRRARLGTMYTNSRRLLPRLFAQSTGDDYRDTRQRCACQCVTISGPLAAPPTARVCCAFTRQA